MPKRPFFPAVVVVVLSVAAACDSAPSTGTSSHPLPAVSPLAPPEPAGPSGPLPSPLPTTFLPASDEPIPLDPERLAPLLAVTTSALRGSIDRWRTEGDPSRGSPPSDVVLQALYQQRIYRVLAGDPRLARRALALAPEWLRPEAAANTTAQARLLSLVHPVAHRTAIQMQRPEPAGVLLGYFKRAGERFGIRWQLLAAVNFVESKFGRVRSPSWAGAQGPMQFLASTWAAYGMGGDIHDPHDTILGAANYLQASGAGRDERRALFAYNPSQAYVDAVSLYAGRMARDPGAYFAYYNWQVYVLTGQGSARLSGP